MEILRRKTEEVSYPLGEDQSKDILNSILKQELSDSDSEALIEELWADEVLLLKKGAVKQQWCKILWFKSKSTQIKMDII